MTAVRDAEARRPAPTTQVGPAPDAGFLHRLANFTVRYRGRVVLAWLAALALVMALKPLAGELTTDYSTPGSESKAAADLLADRFGGSSGDTIHVVWQATHGIRDNRVQAAMRRFVAEAEKLEGVGGAEPEQVSPDGTIAVVRLQLDRPPWKVPDTTSDSLIKMADRASADGVRTEVGGGPIKEKGASPELIALAAAMLILLLAFGSLVAVGLPLATALFGLGISSALLALAAAVLTVPDWAPAVAGLVGIGVGIDYALLILTRFRSALASGADVADATVEAVTTSGRSVLVAGATVVTSMLGLFLVGLPTLRGVAVAASLAVLVVMVAAVTLVPALLAFAGRRIDRFRIRGFSASPTAGKPKLAGRWSALVQRHPRPAVALGLALLLTLAAPAAGLRFGFPDAGNDPARTTTRQAYDLISKGFGPGANGPLVLGVELDSPRHSDELDALAGVLRAQPGVAAVSKPTLDQTRDAAVLTVTPVTSPQDPETPKLVHRLRDHVLPQATKGTGLHVFVGGATAAFIDESDAVGGRLPLFIAAVLGLSLVFILAFFRSPLLALKAALLNVLSVAAAYGVLAVFAEGGSVGRLLGIDRETPVPAAIPVMMFAILFGLSMDYEVFLLSRVREEYLGHGDTARAVVDGVAKTARVITAAAAIMVVVFLAFILSNEVFLKLTGIGMATAILIDATAVRLVLVPALIQLLGRWTWWMPERLDRIVPHLRAEPAPPPLLSEKPR